MADSITPIQQIIAAANAAERVNENFDAASPSMIFGRDARTTSGLDWGFIGGRWVTGSALSSAVISLAASTTSYLVADRATGVVTAATSTTNWNDTEAFGRLYKVVTGATTITSYEDHRGTRPEGIFSAAGASVSGGGVLALTDASTVAVDASAYDCFRVTLGGNRTLGDPTGLTDGQTLLFRIAQDGTGTRTLAYGSKYQFPGGTAPVLSTPASSIDLLTCQYDETDDTLLCVLNKAFA